MRQAKTILLVLLVLCLQSQAQYVQKEFMIGAYMVPPLVNESATPAPADYNGDGKVDLGSRINTGPYAGQFRIDYYNATTWFKKEGWTIYISSEDYGGAGDPVVSADYDGDGTADIAVYFPSTKTWKIDYFAVGGGW